MSSPQPKQMMYLQAVVILDFPLKILIVKTILPEENEAEEYKTKKKEQRGRKHNEECYQQMEE
jgi:nucleoside permease NupC